MLKKKKRKPSSEYKGSVLLGKLPEHLQWSLHNLVAHPVSEVLYLTSVVLKKTVGRGKRLNQFNNWIHDSTIPYHRTGTGRG